MLLFFFKYANLVFPIMFVVVLGITVALSLKMRHLYTRKKRLTVERLVKQSQELQSRLDVAKNLLQDAGRNVTKAKRLLENKLSQYTEYAVLHLFADQIAELDDLYAEAEACYFAALGHVDRKAIDAAHEKIKELKEKINKFNYVLVDFLQCSLFNLGQPLDFLEALKTNNAIVFQLLTNAVIQKAKTGQYTLYEMQAALTKEVNEKISRGEYDQAASRLHKGNRGLQASIQAQ